MKYFEELIPILLILIGLLNFFIGNFAKKRKESLSRKDSGSTSIESYPDIIPNIGKDKTGVDIHAYRAAPKQPGRVSSATKKGQEEVHKNTDLQKEPSSPILASNLLKNKADLRKAVILSEILNRKYT